MRLDETLQRAHNDHWDGEAQRARGKLVLLVEGADDAVAMEAALTSRRPSWSTHAVVIPMGGRERVLSALRSGALPNNTPPSSAAIFGLVDRDVWTEAEVQEAESTGNLFATPGWCMENSFLEASALQQVIFENAEADAAAIVVALQGELERVRTDWVSAGAWWCSLQRRREAVSDWLDIGTRRYGRPVALRLHDQGLLELDLRARLGGGSDSPPPLEAAALAAEVVDEVRRRLAAPVDQQWREFVYGKAVFSDIVIPYLDAQLGKRSPERWRHEFGEGLRAARPYDALLAQLVG